MLGTQHSLSVGRTFHASRWDNKIALQPAQLTPSGAVEQSRGEGSKRTAALHNAAAAFLVHGSGWTWGHCSKAPCALIATIRQAAMIVRQSKTRLHHCFLSLTHTPNQRPCVRTRAAAGAGSIVREVLTNSQRAKLDSTNDRDFYAFPRMVRPGKNNPSPPPSTLHLTLHLPSHPPSTPPLTPPGEAR